MNLEIGGYYRPINQKAYGSNVFKINKFHELNRDWSYCEVSLYDKNGEYRYHTTQNLFFLEDYCTRVQPKSNQIVNEIKAPK